MKFRKGNGGGLKYEHHMIHGLRPVLENMVSWPEVASVNPGRCRRTRSSGPLRLTVQARTRTGVKLAAHGNGVIQEIFVVTADPVSVIRKITDD